MCGIIAAAIRQDVCALLIEGLKRLEYRGYDSAGVAVINTAGELLCDRRVGKVAVLEQHIQQHPLPGHTGIAHTRWATHGCPSENNAHPHASHRRIALVHNGIIENYQTLRQQLLAEGYTFTSQTDSEVIAHLIYAELGRQHSWLAAVQAAVAQLEGAFALAIINTDQPDTVIGVRCGSPLVLGLAADQHFLASDPHALRPLTDRFIYLEEGDIAAITADDYRLWDSAGKPVQRDSVQLTTMKADDGNKDGYRHHMLREIYQQPQAIERTLAPYIKGQQVNEQAFGADAHAVLDRSEAVQIVACGTSYHAAVVAQYWLEAYAHLPCRVEMASEYRYRRQAPLNNSLLVVISQSGETADTLAALRLAKTLDYTATLAICNVAQSSLAREADLSLITAAGVEVGVASTKAFSTQLVLLLLLTVLLGRRHGLNSAVERNIVDALQFLPGFAEQTLALDGPIQRVATQLADRQHALFLGRGIGWPVAMEGALKLKEISYLHAESYPAGELKHGPLALVDTTMPIVVVAPNTSVLAKLKSNLEEVQTRGGQLLVFADQAAGLIPSDQLTVITMPTVPECIVPIIYTLPLQLLAYHVAVIKGTDIDQPRNLAKSVTVE